jgi:phosphoribosylanthranilate isomerase
MDFRIKICGITNQEDARAAADAGADALGLNFYEKSPRYVTADQARHITWGLNTPTKNIAIAGVFVNASRSQIERCVDRGISYVQLHGDESPEFAAEVAQIKQPPDFCRAPSIIRARRMSVAGIAAIASDVKACIDAGVCPAAVLVDAATPGRYGGTGETVSWIGLADHHRWLANIPLILAGGLTPDNVAEAIRIVRPNAVDVASGVESSPGKKDHAKVRDFVAAAREAFDRVS